MNDMQSGSKDLLDTTDCLEAVGVFKGWKNLFFVIMILCLLLLQASFWVVDRGCISPAGPLDEEAETPAAAGVLPASEAPQESASEAPAPAEPNLREPEPPEAVDPNRPAEPNAAPGLSSVDSRVQRAVTWPSGSFLSGITFDQLSWMIRLVNAVLVLTATLYCLTLLFGLKVSMHGRLGGINHISRAFFLSLVLLVLLLPWQKVFGDLVVGAVYTPVELAEWCSAETEDLFDLVLYYLRFSGYGALMLLLLIFSQIRSVRWAKSILRRLEII